MAPALSADELDELAALGATEGPYGSADFIALAVPERDALIAAARREAGLRQALADLLAVGTTTHREFTGGDVTGCLGCYFPWPCPAERARALVGADR